MAGETKKRTQSTSETQDKKYQLIGKATVQLFAESKGIVVSDDVARVLTEDLNYRLREIVSVRLSFPCGVPVRVIIKYHYY